ncbi:v-type proton atpase subunit s1-like protein [Limosa lapponica baueri]|uniref:V-type proton atpase subunit s1-like protein n=1 Tax=Limosa lapponica baueri TaxID=1758121 RepID=A0A2I0TF30_LIMLA|nr:v-type proton atpase subunit s1-like protein [Limosa lapponica baueri]
MERRIPAPIGRICCPSGCRAERGRPAALRTRGADVLAVEGPALFPMERNAALGFLLLFLCVGFAVSVEQMIATVDGRTTTSSLLPGIQQAFITFHRYFHPSLKAARCWNEIFERFRDIQLSTNPSSERTVGESRTHSESPQSP